MSTIAALDGGKYFAVLEEVEEAVPFVEASVRDGEVGVSQIAVLLLQLRTWGGFVVYPLFQIESVNV